MDSCNNLTLSCSIHKQQSLSEKFEFIMKCSALQNVARNYKCGLTSVSFRIHWLIHGFGFFLHGVFMYFFPSFLVGLSSQCRKSSIDFSVRSDFTRLRGCLVYFKRYSLARLFLLISWFQQTSDNTTNILMETCAKAFRISYFCLKSFALSYFLGVCWKPIEIKAFFLSTLAFFFSSPLLSFPVFSISFL